MSQRVRLVIFFICFYIAFLLVSWIRNDYNYIVTLLVIEDHFEDVYFNKTLNT